MGALRHVVMWTLHDSVNAGRFKATLDTCRALVPGMLEFEVGIRQSGLDASCDVVLVSTFETRAALDAYQRHPHHLAVSAVLGPLRSLRTVLDYDVGLAANSNEAPLVHRAEASGTAHPSSSGAAQPPAERPTSRSPS